MAGAGKLSAIPLPEVLFRPEEVVFSSGASLVNDTLLWSHMDKLALVDFDMDTVHAVGTGVL